MPMEIFEDAVWQMSLGERAAVEGVLSQLKPQLAIEIGSMEGASLGRIAAHAREAHSFDLKAPSLPIPANVTLHTGSSHELLPEFLSELADQERNVDFAIVDGDHSSAGVRQDIEDLLNSPALSRGVILVHDTANEQVRRGVDSVHFAAWPKVAHVELDWIPGHLFAEPALRNELWFGLGLIVIDSTRPAYLDGSVYEQRYHPAAPLLAQVRDLILAREECPQHTGNGESDLDAARERIAMLEAELGGVLSTQRRAAMLQAELIAADRRVEMLQAELTAARSIQAELATLRHRYEGCQRAIEDIKSSVSWRMTEPLRTAKRLRLARAR